MEVIMVPEGSFTRNSADSMQEPSVGLLSQKLLHLCCHP